MIDAYKHGKDLYAMIASKVYHNNYEDNLEKHADGSEYPDGKKRRKSVKALLLGILYGMGVESISISIGSTKEEAKSILDGFYNEFPKVRKWMDKNLENGKKNGYVEDAWGRRRRLPDLLLPRYEVKDDSKNISFNPLIGAAGEYRPSDNPLIKKYQKLCEDCKWKKDFDKLREDAKKDGITILDNTGYISQAERQCTNSVIQGSAASMSKRAMILVSKDKEINDLGFKMLIAIHDELIGQCPEENAQKVADRLTYLMRQAALPEITLPFKCDPTIERNWYEEDYSAMIRKHYDVYTSPIGSSKEALGLTKEEALEKIYQENCECTVEEINEYLKEKI